MIPLKARWFSAALSLWLGSMVLGHSATDRPSVLPRDQDYFFENWPSAEGLDLSAVTAIVQAHDGYLWLGTYHGLFRFDGVRFVVFGTTTAPGLRNGRITSLFVDAKGNLWIGHETGEVTRYTQGKFHPENLPFPWVGGAIESIRTDELGDLWLGSVRGGLFRWRDGHCSLLDVREKGWPLWMVNDESGALWVMSNGTVGTIKAGIFEGLRLDAGKIDTNNYERIVPTRDGGFWIQRNGEIGKWRQGGWTLPLRGVPWQNDHSTTELLETASGSLLVGTMRNGLYVFDDTGGVAHFTRSGGLSSDQIRSVAQDREGNVWLGTGDGLCAMRTRKVQMLAAPDGFKGYKVLGFAAHSDGSVWVATQGAGLYRYQNQHWTTYGLADGLPSMFIWSILEAQNSGLLVGTWNNGIVQSRGDQFEGSGPLGQLSIPSVALYQSASGRLWVGTQNGLAYCESDRLVWVAGSDRFSVPDVRSISESPDGSLWFGMLGGGLGRFQNEVVSSFTGSNGLASDSVQVVYADTEGTIWIGTTDAGLCRWKNGRLSTIGVAQGLINSSICQILDDGVGNLWLGTQRGISRVRKDELHRCADGLGETLHGLTYGKAEGMASQTCSGGFQPSASRTKDGRLWFSTVKGIAIIDPSRVSTNPVPPPVVIEEFKVGGKPARLAQPRSSRETQAGDAPLEIPPGRQQFDLIWTGLCLMAPERVRFRYRLEGLEDAWSEPTPSRAVQYSYLRPGAYTFRVIACNNDQVWNETGAALRFVVLPHFWQTWWFALIAISLGAGTVGSGGWLVARRRAGRKLEQMERQRAIERERSRIARDIHDDLGASLTRISMLSQTVRTEFPTESRGSMAADEVHRTARDLTRALDEIVWAVNPRHDSLESLANYLGGFAQDFLSAAGISCRLELPMQLPAWALTAEIRHSLFLAFKEALHNVVKHAAATEVVVSLEPGKHGFVLVVADNGGQLNAVSPNPRCQDRVAAGNGRSNMAGRLEEIGGRCEWESIPGQGTRVRFTVLI